MKKVLSIIANVFLWLIVIFALLITIIVFSSTTNGGVPNILGYIPLTIESQSMSPTFNEGDLIISRQIDDVNSLKVDDVITFWTIIEGRKVKNTHRIVRIDKSNVGAVSFITRGDNNPIDDEIPAYQSDLIGKWTNIRLAGAGNIMAFLRTQVGFFVCILIPMAIFFLFELYKFIVTVIAVKKSEPAPALDEEEIKRRAIEEYLAAQKENDPSGGSDKKDDPPKEEKPAEEKKEPDKEDVKPSEEKKEPAKEDVKPSEDKKEPAKEDVKPSEEKKEPAKEEKKTSEVKEESPKTEEKTGAEEKTPAKEEPAKEKTAEEEKNTDK